MLPWVLPWARVGHGRCCLGQCLGCCLGRGRLATGAALGAALGADLGFVGNLTLLGRKGESASHAGSVGRSSIIFLFARSSIIFLLFGRGSSGGFGLLLLPGGLPLGLGAGCACFVGFFNRKYFLKDLRAQLFDDGVQLVLVAQPPATEELLIDPHGCADEPQLLGAHPGADLHVPASDKERVQGAVGFVELWHVRYIAQDDQHSFFISIFLDVSVILRCLWMMPRSAASSQSSQ